MSGDVGDGDGTAPERIAFAGDWHANTAWARWAIRFAADAGADIIVQPAAADHRDRLRTVVDAVRPGQIWHGHYHRRDDVSSDLGYGTGPGARAAL